MNLLISLIPRPLPITQTLRGHDRSVGRSSLILAIIPLSKQANRETGTLSIVTLATPLPEALCHRIEPTVTISHVPSNTSQALHNFIRKIRKL